MLEKPLKTLLAKIDARSKNERIYLLIAIFVVTGLGWDSWVRLPLAKQQADVDKESAKILKSIKDFEGMERKILQHKDVDLNLPLRRELENKLAQLAQLEADLKKSARNLLSPGEMTRALKSMLTHMAGVTLTGMESHPGEGVRLHDIQQRFMQATGGGDVAKITGGNETKKGGDHATKPGTLATPPNNASDDNVTMYRHGLTVTLAGNFLDIMHYLDQFEALPWTFYWGGLDYTVGGESGSSPPKTAPVLDPSRLGNTVNDSPSNTVGDGGGSQVKLFLSTMSFTDGFIGTDPDLSISPEQLVARSQKKDDTQWYDPTIPGPTLAASTTTDPPADGSPAKDRAKTFHLTSILTSDQRRVAIINGQAIGEKESLGDMTVMAITPLSVRIMQGKIKQEIFLGSAYPWVKKQLIIEKKP